MKFKLIKYSERKSLKYRGTVCLNCSCKLHESDRYCPNCSQINTTKKLSILDFFKEFLESVFTFDSRLRHTVKDLLFKPGKITKEYVNGKRIKYANPFRFYLSVSIIFFILMSFLNLIKLFAPDTTTPPTANKLKIEEKKHSTPIILETFKDSLTSEKFIENLNPEEQQALKEVNLTFQGSYISEENLDTLSWSNALVRRGSLYYNFYTKRKIRDSNKALDSLNHKKNKFNKWLYDKNKDIERVQDNPKAFLNYLLSKIPFFLFFFAPFFAFFFWLIYSKKKYSYMEHLIFIFHVFSFMFLIFSIALIPDFFLGNNIVFAIFFALLCPFYFYKAIRNFYKQNRLVSIIKFLFLNLAFFITVSITALLFFSITAVAY